jgi:predicted DNA-binding WGR domain protein
VPNQQRFELRDASSSKFWCITVDGKSHTVRYGRIGTTGQTKLRAFDSSVDAATAAEKLIKQKTRKGYKPATGPTLVDAVREKMKHHARVTYVAKTKRGDASPAASKIGGLPWLDDKDDWPACGNCKNPMQFLFQLNLQETGQLKGGPKGTGFLQVFYCTTPDTYCDELGKNPFSPFGKHLCARHYHTKRLSAVPIKMSPAPDPLQRKTIIDWICTTEYPTFEDTLRLKDISFTEEETDFMCCNGPTVSSDKLGGWPGFIQGADYPRCPTCKTPMEFIFQLSSFGSRMAFLFRCSKHRSTLAFSWQCS